MDELPSSDKVLVRLKCLWKARMGEEEGGGVGNCFQASFLPDSRSRADHFASSDLPIVRFPDVDGSARVQRQPGVRRRRWDIYMPWSPLYSDMQIDQRP